LSRFRCHVCDNPVKNGAGIRQQPQALRLCLISVGQVA
jgi:hypothetical protein